MQTPPALSKIGIILGYKCQLYCAHCASNSSPSRTEKLSDSEILSLIDDINRSNVSLISFSGGEPTLYPELVSRISNQIPNSIQVEVFTNAVFATSDENIEHVIHDCGRINTFSISYDQYHAEFNTVKNIERLIKYCKKRGIGVKGQVIVARPTDFAHGAVFRNQQIQCTYARILLNGRAKNIAQQVQIEPFSSNSEVMSSTCTNRTSILYVPKRGYTYCCGKFVDDTNKFDETIFANSIKETNQLPFSEKISRTSFREMLETLSQKSNRTHIFSSPCELCWEYIKCIINTR